MEENIKPTPEEIIKRHYQAMAKKSHSTIQKKYGKEYYSKIVKVRWDKWKAKRAEKIRDELFGPNSI